MDAFERLSRVMLPLQAPAGLTREEVMAPIGELEQAERRVKRLREHLEKLLGGDGQRGPP